MAVNDNSTKPYSEQHRGNSSFDREFQVNAVEKLSYNPNGSVDRDVIDTLAVRVDEASATVTYVGEAGPGAATSAAKWRIKKIDTTSGTAVTWADGNVLFDNVWDDRAALTYS